MIYSKIDKDDKVVRTITSENFEQAESILNPDYEKGENILVTYYKDGKEITYLCTENWRQVEKIKDNALYFIEQTHGKIIKTGHKSYDDVAIAFTDGTYIVLKCECDIDEHKSQLVYTKGRLYTLVELGLITQEQHEIYMKEEEERRKAIVYKEELAELERLTRKYNRQ